MVLKTFNLDNYFTKIAENDYFSYKNFLEERKMLMEELFQKIQNEIDKKAKYNEKNINDIEITLSWNKYESICKENFLKNLSLSFSKDKCEHQYIINVEIKDLKNIEKYYNQIMQERERIPLKENYIKERKEELTLEYNNLQK